MRPLKRPIQKGKTTALVAPAETVSKGSQKNVEKFEKAERLKVCAIAICGLPMVQWLIIFVFLSSVLENEPNHVVGT